MNAPSSALEAARRARLAPRFRGWSSLATRILAVNILALLALAGGLLYLESFRARLIESREQELLAQAEIMASFLAGADPPTTAARIAGYSSPRGTRVRLLAPDGRLVADNWSNPAAVRYGLEDPTTAGFRRASAIAIDRLVEFVTGEGPLDPFEGGEGPAQGPEVGAARAGTAEVRARRTDDGLVLLQAAAPVSAPSPAGGPVAGGGPYPVLLLTVDSPDVIDLVRRERAASFLVFLAVLGSSLALSLFLARTIVVPLRQLALAAHRVRLGRARDVVVPRLPHRRDEIGGLARALADMTAALRHRIDATEAFAADVAHELKNPLASLRSAVEALGRVEDPAARAQLFQLISDDVARIDRLISDISAASRIDAELSRTRLHPVDLAALVRQIVSAITAAGAPPRGVALAVEAAGEAPVAADRDRLAQVVNNLLDNAISFSPPGGTVHLAVERDGPVVRLHVDDEGPGVPADARDAIFERFYSERPAQEDYGAHSGLGLSIVRAILDALDGQVRVTDRPEGQPGARFTVTLPAL
jgi:two-component system sensor histidine kinase ChvG